MHEQMRAEQEGGEAVASTPVLEAFERPSTSERVRLMREADTKVADEVRATFDADAIARELLHS